MLVYNYKSFKKEKDRANNEIAKFLQLPIIRTHPNGTVTYRLWSKIIPYAGFGSYDESDCPELKYTDEAHVHELSFDNDWNWLMYAVQEVKTRIIVPMDADRNNDTHSTYQRLRTHFFNALQESDQELIYSIIVEMVIWWYIKTKTEATWVSQ